MRGARWPDGAAEPSLSYEPVGLIDLPPGDRGYGKTESIDMECSVDEYNARVAEGQEREGAAPARGGLHHE